jgi:hypothetical protein
MGRRICTLLVLLPLIGGLVACERSKSSNPLSPSIAGPIAGVTVDAPTAVSPAPASQIAVDQQPITLVIQNATTNSPRPFTYIFEISTDAAFATKVFTQTGIEPGAGTTSVKLPQSLTPERKYYWRVKADDGANASEFTSPAEFMVYTPVVIQAPWLETPSHNSTGVVRKPSLVIKNSTRTGPAGAIQYLFELSTDVTFASKIASSLVNEGDAQTSYSVPNDLAYSTTHYWRVKAMDPGHESVHSGIGVFTTLAAPIIVTPGPVTGPNPTAVDDINLGAATIWNSPSDLASWPATSKITGLDMRSYGIMVDFHKKDGPNRWPDVYPPGWDEPLQYTMGLCFRINGAWHCSASIQYWNGLGHSGGPPSRYSAEWFYDSYRWGPLATHQPAVGETIGVFVCGGDCRNTNSGHKSTVKERTNVVLVPMPSDSGASYSF